MFILGSFIYRLARTFPTTDYEKTIVVTADFVDTTIFGMPVTVKRSTQFGLFYDYFQYD